MRERTSCLRQLGHALHWYLALIIHARQVRDRNPLFYSRPFTEDLNGFIFFSSKVHPVPLHLKEDQLSCFVEEADERMNARYRDFFDAASTIFLHWRIYNLLTASTIGQIHEHTACTGSCRPPIPHHVAHLFRSMPPTDSGRMPPIFGLTPERNKKAV